MPGAVVVLVTLLALLVYVWTGLRVGRAREKFGVAAPAVTGHPEFERAYRVQMNTLEWLPVFLPSLWLFAIYVHPWAAAAIGLVWILARVAYALAYYREPKSRGPAFAIQGLAALVLLLGAIIGVIVSMAHAGLQP